MPYLKPTDKILDVGCGPGTITIGFRELVSQGSVTGIDISEQVISRARDLAAEQTETSAATSNKQLGDISFRTADLFAGLPWPDNTFDAVYASQLFPHLPPPSLPVAALTEMRRVLKPGGVLATRDAAGQHFFPPQLGLDGIWVERHVRSLEMPGWPGPHMPAYYRAAGFGVPASAEKEPAAGATGALVVGVGTTCMSGRKRVRWFGENMAGRLQKGDTFREAWSAAGYSEEEIEESKRAMEAWSETEDAWYACLQCEVLAWK